jgi:hypothetical protein
MALKKISQVAVLTADIIQSTTYSRVDRQRLNRALLKAFDEVLLRFPKAVHKKLTFRITAGDEFQCVLLDLTKILDVLTYLRATLATSGLEPIGRFRASIGVGEISVTGGTSSYQEDGQAFVRAREGLEQLDKSKHGRWTKIVTGQSEVDSVIDVVLILLDYLEQGWTVPQWEAVRWSLLGLTRKEISKKLKIRHQNVTKRLSAAGWHQFKVATKFLSDLLHRTCNP